MFVGGHAEEAAGALRRSVGLNAKSLQAHLLLATALDQLGRGKEAAGEWRAALGIDPTSALALDGVAKSLLAANDFAGVIQLLETAPPDENLALDLGIAYDRAGKLNQAAAELAKAGEAFPASTKLANALALVYLRQLRHRDAAALMEKQYALHPDDLETQVDYLRVLVISEDREKAFPLGKIVLARLPHDFTALYLNGQLERETGDYAAAKAHLEEAVRLDPDHANCRYNLGVALARLNEPAAAKAEFEKAIALGWSGPEIHYELANAARALGDGETAKAQMLAYQRETRAKEQRDLAVNKMGQGDEAMRAGDFAGAEAQYRLAAGADAELAPAWIGLAVALGKEGKLLEAKEAVGQALRVDPGNARARAMAQSLGLRAEDGLGSGKGSSKGSSKGSGKGSGGSSGGSSEREQP